MNITPNDSPTAASSGPSPPRDKQQRAARAVRAGHGPRVTITASALLQRINRALAKTGPGHWYSERVHVKREEPRSGGLGKLFLIDSKRNWVTDPNVDLEALGRELDVMEPWEELEAS